MRLTSLWCCPTSAGSAGDSSDDTESGITIHYSSPDSSGGPPSTEHPAAFVPESDSELVAALDEMETPVTVDEIADELIHPAQPSVETWAAVHEHLHEHRLSDLDAAGYIEFDEEQGLVEQRTVRSDAIGRGSSSGTGLVSIRLLLVVFVVLSAFTLVAATVTISGI